MYHILYIIYSNIYANKDCLTVNGWYKLRYKEIKEVLEDFTVFNFLFTITWNTEFPIDEFGSVVGVLCIIHFMPR